MGCFSSKIAEIEHPDIIKASLADVLESIKVLDQEKADLEDQLVDLRSKYVEYIGEERIAAIENDTVWQNCTEPKFTRNYINSKDSNLLREMASKKKQIGNIELKVKARYVDSEVLNERLAQSMSLTSAHGQVHFMRFERDKALQEKADLEKELEKALDDAKTNLLRKLAAAPFMLMRFKEWSLKYYIPGPDPRNRQNGCQERTVSALIVEPSSPESFLALIADLSSHRGSSTNYGFSLTSKEMLTMEWGFLDPMPIHGTHTLDGKTDTVFEDIADIGDDEVILLGFHYNRFRTNVIQQGAFKLPETSYDHYHDSKHFCDLLHLQGKISEIPGILATLSYDSSKKYSYSLKVMRTQVL